MAAHVICVTTLGGIPIFSRKKGEGDTMTFSQMASMNAINMFLKSKDITLISTRMPDKIVVWKEFADVVTLIAAASGTTQNVLEKFLEAVFSAMILVAGIDEIKNPRNIERLKKDLRNCNSIIDKLLDCLDTGNRTSIDIDLLGMPSSVICPEIDNLHCCLNAMLEDYLGSDYGCILIHGCVALATESWLELDPIEKKLLIMAISMNNNSCCTCDYPVFLPKMSPNIALRLISVTLVTGVQLVALCGPTPEMIEIEKIVIQHWKNDVGILRAAAKSFPQYLPSDITLDPAILGLLLVDVQNKKFIVRRNLNQSSDHQIGTQRLDILKTFYYQAVEPFFLVDQEKKSTDREIITYNVKEKYWSSEFHKCHALKEKNYVLCVLYTFSTPNHSMRLITSVTLKNLTTYKQLGW